MKQYLIKKLQLKKMKKMSILDRFILVLTIIGALIILILLGNVVYSNLPQDPIAYHLPAEETLMYIEVNNLRFPSKLQSKTAKDQSKLTESLGQAFGIDLIPILTSWGKDHLAYALLNDDSNTNHSILFIQTKTKRGALKYFEKLLLPNEKFLKSTDENPIYSYPQGQSFSFTFIDKYVVFAKNNKALELIKNKNKAYLQNDIDYQKSINNLPRNKWILGYINFKKLNFGKNIAINNIVEPLKHAIHHIAFTVRKDQEGFHFNTFLNLDKNLLSLDKNENKTKFAYELTNYILEDNLALYIGGANLEAEWQNTLETISNLNPAYGIILEGIVRAQANNIFGGQIDLRNDIYPLFAGEYALSIGKDELGKSISLILAHNDKEFAETKLKKLSVGFKFLAAKFAPQIKVVQLPDGTESRELVPDNSKVVISEEKYNGYNIYCTEVAETIAGFCYTVTDEIIIITNSKSTLINTIDLDKKTLSSSTSFRKTLGNLSKISDEITYLNFDNFIELQENNKYIQTILPLISKLDSASWVKHYFTDGVSTEGYILVK